MSLFDYYYLGFALFPLRIYIRSLKASDVGENPLLIVAVLRILDFLRF